MSESTESSQPAQSELQGFPEGKTFIATAIAFIVCRYLTTTWLPAPGLQAVAHQYVNIIGFLAPYILLPICLVVSVQILRRSLLPGLIAIFGSIIIDIFFFISYRESQAWFGLITIGVAVFLSYLRYALKSKMFLPPPPISKAQRLRRNIIFAGVYLGTFLLSIYVVDPLVKPLHPGGRIDLLAVAATLPTIVSLIVYVVYCRLRHRSLE